MNSRSYLFRLVQACHVDEDSNHQTLVGLLWKERRLARMCPCICNYCECMCVHNINSAGLQVPVSEKIKATGRDFKHKSATPV